MMFNLTLETYLFGILAIGLLAMTIFALIDAYNVLFVEDCVKHRTRSLVLFWCGVLSAFGWIIIIFSAQGDPNPMTVLNGSNCCLFATYILFWSISNRRNLVFKNDVSK